MWITTQTEITEREGDKTELDDPIRNLKKASRLKPLRWKVNGELIELCEIIASASWMVALSCFWDSIKKRRRWSADIISLLPEYWLNRNLIPGGASGGEIRNRRRKQRHTLNDCLSVVAIGKQITERECEWMNELGGN